MGVVELWLKGFHRSIAISIRVRIPYSSINENDGHDSELGYEQSDPRSTEPNDFEWN